MPILHQGYEAYHGTVRLRGPRFLSIARAALARNRRWYVWILLLMGLLFGSGFEFIVIFISYAAQSVLQVDPQTSPFLSIYADSPAFYAAMMVSQSYWAMFLGAVVGAGEIAEDLRSGALVFYLGRPVTRTDYVLGKVAAVSIPVLLVSLAPTLLLFAWHASLMGSAEWVLDRWRIPLAAVGYGLLLSLFVSGLVLGVSALARRRRWATVGIAALYLGLILTAGIVAKPRYWTAAEQRDRAERVLRRNPGATDREALLKLIEENTGTLDSRRALRGWRVLSPTSSLEAAGRDLFGLPLPDNFGGGRHWIFLLGLSGGFLWILWKRVRAVEVVT